MKSYLVRWYLNVSVVTCCLAFVGISAGAQRAASNQYNIIPYPAMLNPGTGTFVINNQTTLTISREAARFQNEKTFPQKLVRSYLGADGLKKVRQCNRQHYCYEI
jgi:hypothetical protein